MNGYAIIVRLKIAPEGLERYMRAAAENARLARETEPGCAAFHLFVNPEDNTELTVCEVYVDEEAFKAHQQTVHFRKLRESAGAWIKVLERRVLTLPAQ